MKKIVLLILFLSACWTAQTFAQTILQVNADGTVDTLSVVSDGPIGTSTDYTPDALVVAAEKFRQLGGAFVTSLLVLLSFFFKNIRAWKVDVGPRTKVWVLGLLLGVGFFGKFDNGQWLASALQIISTPALASGLWDLIIRWIPGLGKPKEPATTLPPVPTAEG